MADKDIFITQEQADGSLKKVTLTPTPSEVLAIEADGTLGLSRREKNTKPQGMARMLSISESGTISASLKSSTGYLGVRWWDGTVEVVGDGSSGSPHSASKAVPSWNADWSGPSPKEIYIWSATGAADPTQSGDITEISSVTSDIVFIDLDGLDQLTKLLLTQSNLSSIDLSTLTSLQELTLYGHTALTAIDVSNNPLLTKIELTLCSIDYIDLSANTLLTDLFLSQTNITSLDLSNNPLLLYLYATNCVFLESLNISGVNSLQDSSFSGCTSLTSVTAIGFTGAADYVAAPSYSYPISFSNCGITTDELHSMLTQCGTAADSPSGIVLTGNPCDDDASLFAGFLTDGATKDQADITPILTAKGFSLILSEGTLAP